MIFNFLFLWSHPIYPFKFKTKRNEEVDFKDQTLLYLKKLTWDDHNMIWVGTTDTLWIQMEPPWRPRRSPAEVRIPDDEDDVKRRLSRKSCLSYERVEEAWFSNDQTLTTCRTQRPFKAKELCVFWRSMVMIMN